MKSFEQPVLKSIHEFLGPGLSTAPYMEAFTPKGIPVWAKDFADFYRVEIDSEKVLTLVKPRTSNDIEKIITLYRVLKNLKQEYVLIIAEDFSSKAKQELIKNRIPHITSSGSIFAPELGVIYKDQLPTSTLKPEYSEKLSALAQKLVAAYLIDENFFKEKETLSTLAKRLKSNVSSLSKAFHQLRDVEILEFKGNGPNRHPTFYNKEIVWSRLLELETETISKKTKEIRLPDKNKYQWVYSNDSALTQISDLNAPSIPIIAMSAGDFRKWQSDGTTGESKEVIIEVWRDEAPLLTQNNCINPIELALSLRRTREPRTQLAISKVIDELGLNSNLLWDRR